MITPGLIPGRNWLTWNSTRRMPANCEMNGTHGETHCRGATISSDISSTAKNHSFLLQTFLRTSVFSSVEPFPRSARANSLAERVRSSLSLPLAPTPPHVYRAILPLGERSFKKKQTTLLPSFNVSRRCNGGKLNISRHNNSNEKTWNRKFSSLNPRWRRKKRREREREIIGKFIKE